MYSLENNNNKKKISAQYGTFLKWNPFAIESFLFSVAGYAAP